MADKTTAEIAQDYTAMGHSVSLITKVIAGDAMDGETDAEKKNTCCKKRRTLRTYEGYEKKK